MLRASLSLHLAPVRTRTPNIFLSLRLNRDRFAKRSAEQLAYFSANLVQLNLNGFQVLLTSKCEHSLDQFRTMARGLSNCLQ